MAEQSQGGHEQPGISGVGGGGSDGFGGGGDAGIGGTGEPDGVNPSGAASGRSGCGAAALIGLVGLGAAVSGAVTAAVNVLS